jgi:hypothetical protein
MKNTYDGVPLTQKLRKAFFGCKYLSTSLNVDHVNMSLIKVNRTITLIRVGSMLNFGCFWNRKGLVTSMAAIVSMQKESAQ